MNEPSLCIRPALAADLAELHPLIERAYRGDAARGGWTHEADLIEGQRIEMATLAAIVADDNERLLVASRGGQLVGSVQISNLKAAKAYLGLLTVDPGLQTGGLGRRLIEAAEAEAKSSFGAETMELTVIAQRSELIAYYERRGYALTGEKRPFPIPLTPPLELVVLTKALA